MAKLPEGTPARVIAMLDQHDATIRDLIAGFTGSMERLAEEMSALAALFEEIAAGRMTAEEGEAALRARWEGGQ
jgi:hypothetical protein